MQDEFAGRLPTGFLSKGSPIATSSKNRTTSLYQKQQMLPKKYEARPNEMKSSRVAQKKHRLKR